MACASLFDETTRITTSPRTLAHRLPSPCKVAVPTADGGGAQARTALVLPPWSPSGDHPRALFGDYPVASRNRRPASCLATDRHPASCLATDRHPASCLAT